MKVRKITSDGDYQLGHGNLDFFQDTADGVAQNVMTRLALWRGTWFIDTQAGTPWLQEVLGKHDAVDVVLRSRILETPGVLSIKSFESILNLETRRLTISAIINTQFGDAELMETI
jgi:hypothetical protein